MNPEEEISQFEEYLKTKTPLVESTVYIYKQVVVLFLNNVNTLESAQGEWSPTLDDVNLFLNEYSKNKWNYHYAFALKHYLRYKGLKHLIKDVQIYKKRRRKKMKKDYEDGVVREILFSIDDPTFRDIAAFQYVTACREAEAFTLRWEDIQRMPQYAVVRLIRKGDREGKTYINTTTFNSIFRKYKTQNEMHGYVFFPKLARLPPDGRARALRCLRSRYDRALQRAADKHGDVLNSHDIRRHLANKLLDKNHNIMTVKEVLGHASITTTNIYLRERQKEAKSAILGMQGVIVHEDEGAVDVQG